ncbi:translation initiation factor IF-2-like [Cygnus olor]|uniref:translation initiation factor IF-2-like n=1 Tax=Cygnus olor TaxID=8869 RepID=UPI001ADE5605|nr:translation initiation factor IF-2-like [Cygnus olor]
MQTALYILIPRRFYGRVYKRRALRGRGRRWAARARSPPSSRCKQVFPRPPTPYPWQQLPGALQTDGGRHGETCGPRQGRGKRQPGRAAPEPRLGEEPQSEPPRHRPAPPGGAAAARRAAAAPPGPGAEGSRGSASPRATPGEGKNHGQAPPQKNSPQTQQLALLLGTPRAAASVDPRGGQQWAGLKYRTPPQRVSASLRGLTPQRVSRRRVCPLTDLPLRQAWATLCCEDMKKIVILRHGVSTRASAAGEGSGF